MKRRYNIMVTILVIAVFLINSTVCAASGESSAPGNLYALSAVLMDGDSGRVLYEKEGETPRANASTTKVLTCILALEDGKGDDYVQVSSNAAAQPDVRLGIQKGEQYYLEDLLYSLMLQSHNDAAVAIAEHIGGSVEGFAAMMNQKAKEIGCTDTHFVTPNGLDAKDDGEVIIQQRGTWHLSCAMPYRIRCSSRSPRQGTILFQILRRSGHFLSTMRMRSWI